MGSWSYQLNKYLCRILGILRNCAPTGVMDNSRLLDGAITCQMMLNYIIQGSGSSFIAKFFPQVYNLMDLANSKVICNMRAGLGNLHAFLLLFYLVLSIFRLFCDQIKMVF
jgi:hypothetical protein